MKSEIIHWIVVAIGNSSLPAALWLCALLVLELLVTITNDGESGRLTAVEEGAAAGPPKKLRMSPMPRCFNHEFITRLAGTSIVGKSMELAGKFR